MPVGFDFFERLFLQRMNKGPAPMLDLVAMLGFKATTTAIRLGLFEALEQGAAVPAIVAGRCAASEKGVRRLLEVLEPLGYVARRGDVFANTPLTERWMLRSSPECLADLFLMFDDMGARWDNLDESVRAGQSAVDVEAWLAARKDGFRNYHSGLRAVASLLAPEIVARVPLPEGARRLLDLGGSHGLYAARFCRKHRQLSATVMDLPSARESAEETILREEMQGRVAFRHGDFSKDDLGTEWDVILLFAVARTMSAESLKVLLRRIRESLAAGGRLVLMDQLDEKPGSPFKRANARVIHLELFHSSPGDVHSSSDLRRWILAEGFRSARYVPLRRSGGQGVIVAERE